ncbi:MAG: hypothetical protein AVDCRST_MAG14-1657, partial [uncultured Rubrobacteraceae bacterium]
ESGDQHGRGAAADLAGDGRGDRDRRGGQGLHARLL